MASFTGWDEMTDKEKIETLHQTCAGLTQRIEQQGAWINGLLSRLKAVEDRNRFSGT